ncbi:MAG: NAD(P)H-binding protein [Pseudohongiella sp.]|nr:NAD(P)H-binding protein [Pseudohongiella sp.]
MRILVTGATGFIGRHILQALVRQAGYETVAAVRSPRHLNQLFPGIPALQMDASDCSVAQLSNALQGFDLVINAIGILNETASQRFGQLHIDFPCYLAQACQQSGVRRLIHISALGADDSAVSAYHQSKHAADVFIRTLDMESVIIKPSLVYGVGGTSSQLFAALSALPVQTLVDHGAQRVQPVHIDDLADAVLRLTNVSSSVPAELPAELEVVGPAPMSFRDMLRTYRLWLGYGEVRVLSIPWPFVLCIARLVRHTNRWLSEDNLQMLRQGNTASASGLTQLLSRPPRALEEALSPGAATEAERWHARLYFLLPVLRLSVAFVWIFTGLVSLFLYPREDSYALLAQVGLTGNSAVIALCGAALLDIALGMALLRRWQPKLVGVLQLLVILGYTLLISIFLPEYWLHPYGPVTKNLPLLVAILMLMAVDKR